MNLSTPRKTNSFESFNNFPVKLDAIFWCGNFHVNFKNPFGFPLAIWEITKQHPTLRVAKVIFLFQRFSKSSHICVDYFKKKESRFYIYRYIVFQSMYSLSTLQIHSFSDACKTKGT